MSLKSTTINAQIKATEQRLQNHQHAVDYRTDALAGNIQRQLVKPASLLLAASIGFILGELTRHSCRTAKNPNAVETSPLKTAFSLIGSARSLYAALPLLLMITSRNQVGAPGQGEAKSSKARARRTL
jgi:hypothetical protein